MMNYRPKVKAVANIAQNRLYLTISGNVDTKTLNALYTDIRFCVADLEPGFIVIEDFSECNLLYLNGLAVYKKIMDYLVANRVGEIIRVVQNTISHKQIQHYTDGIQCYKTMYVDQIEEAEKKLQETMRRDGIRFKLNGSYIEYTCNGHVNRGTLLDLSISGCAVGVENEVPAVGQELPFALFFDKHDIHTSHFQMNAKVVRAIVSTFAVHFLDLGDERREQLHQRLAYEVGRTVVPP
jgi:hypothetical protein